MSSSSDISSFSSWSFRQLLDALEAVAPLPPSVEAKDSSRNMA
ncbi:hypothetical protein PC118_g25019 [Phytophthora cactorum]|uniref:Uncharacterized protein n=1 Tax=Phytophthora cactorum TaxID=29920 RepID=A0A8T1A5E0_9STRA|nr:hypothetical protein PC112_g24875 [Phytophthora cactorum]KAG2871306.1 hypothetical protein PC115_g24873 [Phytophthora cactorum]KAG2952914.1 hypothetical protein PC118_g25019 [Phytophthora cactorum]KAG3116583.1 hypothetical protein C6341_g27594 [Phytophthora cactorum]